MLTSAILKYLHVTLDYFIVINIGGIVILLVLAIIVLCKLANMKKKYKQFMRGANGYNLEQIVLDQREEIEELKNKMQQHDDDITTISSHFSEVYSKIHVKKYDAFKDVGGNMSFVLVLLNIENNGIIINSIRNTDGNYIYLKEVKNGKCETPLCKEEMIALKETVEKSV
jgi:hypothetical protein